MESSDDEYDRWLLLLSDILAEPLSVEFALFIILILFMLVCSAFISGAEVAFFSLSPQDIQALEDKKNSASTRSLRLLEKPKRLLATILIANNFINVAIIIFSTWLVSRHLDIASFPYLGLFIETIIVTFMIIFFGEVVPKVFASANNLKLVAMMTVPLLFLRGLFDPLSKLMVSSSKFIEKRIKKYQTSQSLSLEDINQAIDLAVNADASEQEVGILKGIVTFGNISVKQIMRSRVDMVAFDIGMKFTDLLIIVKESGFSRIPVYSGDFDKILGILYVKDLLKYIDNDDSYKWQDLIRPSFFVPESKKIYDLLKEFQSRRIHMAIAVDEYGGTAGLVTLEDIMEEVIGEIKDERDEADEIHYSKIDDQNYIFEGKTLLNDICKVINVSAGSFDEVKGDSDSLAGLVLELVGEIPIKNTETSFKNFKFTVISVGENRIRRVKITVLPIDEKVNAD